MARGDVSAAKTMSSDVPRLRVLVASFAPYKREDVSMTVAT